MINVDGLGMDGAVSYEVIFYIGAKSEFRFINIQQEWSQMEQ